MITADSAGSPGLTIPRPAPSATPPDRVICQLCGPLTLRRHYGTPNPPAGPGVARIRSARSTTTGCTGWASGRSGCGASSLAADGTCPGSAWVRLRARPRRHDLLHRTDAAAPALRTRGRPNEVGRGHPGRRLPRRHADRRAARWSSRFPARRPAGGPARADAHEHGDAGVRLGVGLGRPRRRALRAGPGRRVHLGGGHGLAGPGGARRTARRTAGHRARRGRGRRAVRPASGDHRGPGRDGTGLRRGGRRRHGLDGRGLYSSPGRTRRSRRDCGRRGRRCGITRSARACG